MAQTKQNKPLLHATLLMDLMQVKNQIQIFHWQTGSYAEHMAFGSLYSFLDETLDRLVESISGKYNRIKLAPRYKSEQEGACLELHDYADIELIEYFNEIYTYLSETIYRDNILQTNAAPSDMDIQDIILDILNELNKTKYLLTLK